MFLADLHVHSTFSDGQMSIPELVDFYGSRGFGAIAITDHLCEEKALLGKFAHYLEYSVSRQTFPHYIKVIKEEAARAMRRYSMKVIPGFEISKNSFVNSRSAHILALGVEEYISADLDVVDICNEIHRLGGLAIAAHPVSTGRIEPQTYYLWDRREKFRPYFDAWEVASGPLMFPQVEESDLPKVASSDLHRASQIVSWKTELSGRRDWETVKNSIGYQDLGFQFYREV